MTAQPLEPTVEPDEGDYLDEPDYTEAQDDDTEAVLIDARDLFAARAFTQPTPSQRPWDDALAWLANQSHNPTQNWAGLCQKCMRMADGCPGGFSSALDQWFGMPHEYRFVEGSIKDAPIGADLFSRSRNEDSSSFQFGHIVKKARPFNNGAVAIWSTDAVRVGGVDKVNPFQLYEKWDHDYLGWGYNINGRVIDLKDPRPVQSEKYIILATALVNLDQLRGNYRVGRETAKDHKEWDDVQRIQKMLDDANKLRRTTRIALNDMRHAA